MYLSQFMEEVHGIWSVIYLLLIIKLIVIYLFPLYGKIFTTTVKETLEEE